MKQGQAMKNFSERRHSNRRKFSYYMQVLNDDTQELVGHLTDISPRGFKLDSSMTLPTGVEYPLRMELTSDMADRPYMVFLARTKWCSEDRLMPNIFNIGFEIVEILPEDAEIFARILEKYGE
jgi:hypothetical protein